MTSAKIPEIPDNVAAAISDYPSRAQKRLLAIRKLIYQTAAAQPGVGELTETLKWGEPAYLTEKTKSGSTIRVDYKEKLPDQVALYFNCQTTIVGDIRRRYGGDFECRDNRAVLIDLDGPLPREAIKGALRIALTYHLNKHSSKRR